VRASGGGDGSSYVALAATIAATVEIPFFLAGAAIAARLGLRALYVMGLLGIGVCSVIYALSPSAELLVVARGLIGIGYSGMLLASVLSIRAIVPDELQATGQALFQSVSYGLAIAIAALAGGLIYGAIGSAPLFALAALILFACIPLALRVAAR
jgi:MFS family permease